MTDFTPSPQSDSEPIDSEESSGKSNKKLIGGLAALAVLVGVAGVGAYAYSALSSSGDYPHAHMGSGAFMYVQTNMDPDAGQKLAVRDLSKKFPELDEDEAKVLEADNLNAALLRAITDSEDKTFEWAGDRMAVAAYPDNDDEDDEPQTAVLIEATDVEAAKADFEELKTGFESTPGPTYDLMDGDIRTETPNVEYSVEIYDDKWVGVTNGDPAEVFSSSSTLSDDEAFDEFGEEEGKVAAAWVDLELFSTALETSGEDAINLEGQATLGINVRDDGIDVTSRAFGVLLDGEALGVKGDAGALEDLAESVSYEAHVGTLGISGLGEAVEKAVETDESGMTSEFDNARGILGDRLAFSLAGDNVEDLDARLVIEGVDKAAWDELLASQGLTLENAETILGPGSTVAIEDGTLTAQLGDEPTGAQDLDAGQVTGLLELDAIAELIHNFSYFGSEPEGEAPSKLGTVEFSVNTEDNGDGEGVLSWTTPR